MKIDILEAYVWISEVFRVKSGFYRSTGRLPEPPRELYGPKWALVEERRGGQGWAARPSPLVRIGQGEGAGPSLSFPPSANPIPTRIGGGGILLPEGVGLSWRALLGRPPPPFSPLYTEAGAPQRHTS